MSEFVVARQELKLGLPITSGMFPTESTTLATRLFIDLKGIQPGIFALEINWKLGIRIVTAFIVCK